MTSLAFTPELIRNMRIQLRQRRMLAVGIICAAVSLTAIVYYGRLYSSAANDDLLRFIVPLQIVVLAIGGGVYALQSVHREKELNTFDYQRVTRLTPLELAFGKLFGAPALAYFIVLCLMPIAFWACARSTTTLATLLVVYVIVFLTSIVYHAAALLTSLLMKGGAAAGGVLFFLVLLGFGSADYSRGSYTVHSLSPFFATDLLTPSIRSYQPPGAPPPLSPFTDAFFGVSVSHVLVLIVISLTFTAWLLLAIVRNIKRDPAAYEVFSPVQGFAVAMYLEFLLLGFTPWEASQTVRVTGNQFATVYRPISPAAAETAFLSVSLWIFAILALALLRNRDRIRRRTRALAAHPPRGAQPASGFWESLWPAPYLLLGAGLAGLAIVAMIRAKLEPQPDWTPGLGILEVAFFVLWLCRDALYLQWMNLRRTARPLLSALMYLGIFYACATAAMVGFGWNDAAHAPYRAVLIPSPAFELNSFTFASASTPWLAALFVLLCEALVFAWLQRRALQSLLAPPVAPSAAAPSSGFAGAND